MEYFPVMSVTVALAGWPVLLTSVVAGSGAGSTIGPNSLLVTLSELPAWSSNQTSTLISLPVSASTRRYLDESAPMWVSASPSTRIHL